jgi:LPXTG-site transpeptidase (sortase) family protein
MSERPLLLSAAKTGVLVSERRRAYWMRMASIVVGCFVILVGLADVTSRMAEVVGDTNLLAFGPAITLLDPGAVSVVRGVAATSSVFAPSRIKIDSLGINAVVVPVGNKEDGTMDTPKKFNEVGWYKLGSKVGEAGNAVFAGHVNNALTQSGVFEHLSDIKQGDIIELYDIRGSNARFEVFEMQSYEPEDAPLERIFSKTGPSTVVLITCEGEWDSAEGEFTKRLVVFAKPARR